MRTSRHAARGRYRVQGYRKRQAARFTTHVTRVDGAPEPALAVQEDPVHPRGRVQVIPDGLLRSGWGAVNA